MCSIKYKKSKCPFKSLQILPINIDVNKSHNVRPLENIFLTVQCWLSENLP